MNCEALRKKRKEKLVNLTSLFYTFHKIIANNDWFSDSYSLRAMMRESTILL